MARGGTWDIAYTTIGREDCRPQPESVKAAESAVGNGGRRHAPTDTQIYTDTPVRANDRDRPKSVDERTGRLDRRAAVEGELLSEDDL